MTLRYLLAAALLLAGVCSALPGAGQDVRLLGEIHGTRPPPAYFEQLLRDPDSFQFEREGLDRLSYIQTRRPVDLHELLLREGGAARSLGPRDAPVVGVFRFPLVLGLFADSPGIPPHSLGAVQAEFFDGPNSYYQTIPEYYDEMSRGALEMVGVTFDWVRSNLTAAQATQGNSGLSSHSSQGVGGFIESLLRQLDAMGVDWNVFDNTGDGIVDVLTVMHPTQGGECAVDQSVDPSPANRTAIRNNRIWSHRWSLRNATGGRLDPGYRTATPRADGNGFVMITDYTIQPVLACDSQNMNSVAINQIGVYAHELGHGFGLPDLYGTGSASHLGSGNWDLMGTGSWGCQGTDPARPCHMGAWSKAMMGWIEIEEVERDRDHGTVTLGPVRDGRVLKVPAGDGSGEYLLLENRQRLGSDGALFEPGLLVWHIDPWQIGVGWPGNAVNSNRQRMGVWLRQADGLNQLAGTSGNRGDRGDPFPGCIIPDSLRFHPDPPCGRRTSFHIGTNPAAVTHGGIGMGITLSGIELTGSAPHDVRFGLDTRFQWDSSSVQASVEAARLQDIQLEVAGAPAAPEWRFVSGALPDGLSFVAPQGRIVGTTMDLGTYRFSLSAADGAGRQLVAEFELMVNAPIIPISELVALFVGQPDPLTPALREFMDRQGNRNTFYDIGDFRAYLQANPNLPSTSAEPSLTRIRIHPGGAVLDRGAVSGSTRGGRR